MKNMKVLKFMPIFVLVLGLYGCPKAPVGHLGGHKVNGPMSDVEPFGMVKISQQSFMMGPNSESDLSTQHDDNVMVSVNAFWMDEHEITNSEYRQFVYWVRDSIAYEHLFSTDPSYKTTVTRGQNTIDKIDWSKKIDWNKIYTSGAPEAVLYDEMFRQVNGNDALRTELLIYAYSWLNYEEAQKHENRLDPRTGKYNKNSVARVDTFMIDPIKGITRQTIERRPVTGPESFITQAMICVYPDTAVWERDFQNSFNESLLHGYFSMPAYSDYPVVGVTWEQAHAFCHWRTQYLRDNTKELAHVYRLPTEAEWEAAARGGKRAATYPWGEDYARDAKGCFKANFKPYRGSYSDDTGTATMAVGGFLPNDFGLYDMAGNVAEWTSTLHTNSTNQRTHDMNPEYPYMARENDPVNLKRKVVKGGSWKDIAYYLQCGVRTYEYQFECRSYIGFRCVRSAM